MTKSKTRTVSLPAVLLGLLFLGALVALASVGSARRGSDVLPGEDIAYSDTQDELHDWLSYRGAPQPVDEEKAGELLAQLSETASKVYPCVAEFAVQVRPLESERKPHEYPIARFQLEAVSHHEWYVSEMRSQGSLFVQHDSEGMYGGVPWQDLIYSTGRSEDSKGAGPLTLGEDVLSPANLIGIDNDKGLVHFAVNGKDQGFLRMYLAIDKDTAVVKRAEALLEIKTSLHEPARRFIAVQVLEDWSHQDDVKERTLREGPLVHLKPDGSATYETEKKK